MILLWKPIFNLYIIAGWCYWQEYKVGDKMITCCCGKLIAYNHECSFDGRLVRKAIFSLCLNSCSHCDMVEANNRYENQWKYDDDGYATCAECGDPCGRGAELPKECMCYWYVDEKGTSFTLSVT